MSASSQSQNGGFPTFILKKKEKNVTETLYVYVNLSSCVCFLSFKVIVGYKPKHVIQ